MMNLQLQSSQVKRIYERSGLLYIFSVSGVDVYRKSDWQRVAWAVLAGCRGGAVNDLGVWLATEFGLWHLPLGSLGPSTSRLTKTYSEASVTALQSADVRGVDAAGTALLVVTDVGVDYLPTLAEVYRFASVGCPGSCAIGAGRIAYAVAAGCHVLQSPSADWTAGDATVLTAAGPLLSDTVRVLAWGADLFIGSADGINIYNPVTGSTALIAEIFGGVTDVRTLWPTSDATASAGYCAFGTSDGLGGGQFGILALG